MSEQSIKTKYDVGDKVWVIGSKFKDEPSCKTCGHTPYRKDEHTYFVEESLIRDIAIWIDLERTAYSYSIKRSYGGDLNKPEEKIYATEEEAQEALKLKTKTN